MICFGHAVAGQRPGMSSPWQSGELEDHAMVLLATPTIYAFFPLVVFSMTSLVCWTFAPFVLSTHRWVRVGLYSGVVVSLTLCIALMCVIGIASQFAALFVAPGLMLLVWTVQQVVRKRFSILFIMILTTAIAALLSIAVATVEQGDLFEFFGGTYLFTVAAAPTLCVITFLRTSVAASVVNARLAVRDEVNPSRWAWLAAWGTWLAGYAATWKVALEIEAVEYAKLPTTNPNCFVCSAAAHGHVGLVGAKSSDGIMVNTQMRRLKLLEFAMQIAMPQTHRRLRNVYNCIGPPMASICRKNAWLADVAFLVLKPLEWIALVVQRYASISQQTVDGIYERSRHH